MYSAASTRLRRCRLAPVLSNRPELRLDNLFARTFAHLDHALVVFLARLGNAEDMLASGNIAQHNAS